MKNISDFNILKFQCFDTLHDPLSMVYVQLKCCKKKEDILRQNLCLFNIQYGWRAQRRKYWIGKLNFAKTFYFIKSLWTFYQSSWIWPSSETMLFLVSFKSSFSREGNSYLGMDGACPEPGFVGVEDGGDVLQLPLGQLPVVRQQHRGSALHCWWRRTLRFQRCSWRG